MKEQQIRRPRRGTMLSTILVGACLVAMPWREGVGQAGRSGRTTSKTTSQRAPSTAKKPAVDPSSTLSGVYTDAQATRGRYVYLGSCKSCHSPDSHTGATFAQWWKGKQLSDLYQFILERMPKNDPGSLAEEDVADVVAFLLKMNAMPVGKNELYPSIDSVKKFRIDLKSQGGTSTAKGGGANP